MNIRTCISVLIVSIIAISQSGLSAFTESNYQALEQRNLIKLKHDRLLSSKKYKKTKIVKLNKSIVTSAAETVKEVSIPLIDGVSKKIEVKRIIDLGDGNYTIIGSLVKDPASYIIITKVDDSEVGYISTTEFGEIELVSDSLGEYFILQNDPESEECKKPF